MGAIGGEDDKGVAILWVELPHHLAAATAGRQHFAVFVNGDNQGDLRFVGFEHFSNGCMLRTKAEAAGEIETDT